MLRRKIMISVSFIVIMETCSFLLPKEIKAGCSGNGTCVPSPGCDCSQDTDCHGCGCVDYGGSGGNKIYCVPKSTCFYGKCSGTIYICDGGDKPEACGNCFSPETKIEGPKNSREIQDLEEGDEVVGFDSESGKETSALVKKVYEVTRSAYYKITTQDGREVKVTGSHPLYAVQKENVPLSFWEYLETESLIKKAVDYLF